MKNFIIRSFVVLLLLVMTLSGKVYAADFKTDYEVEYNLSQFKEGLSSNVRFKIIITNLRGDVYVNKFAISFPRSFAIQDNHR